MLVRTKPCPLNCLIHWPSVQNEGTDQVLDDKVDAFKAQVQDRKGKDIHHNVKQFVIQKHIKVTSC